MKRVNIIRMKDNISLRSNCYINSGTYSLIRDTICYYVDINVQGQIGASIDNIISQALKLPASL